MQCYGLYAPASPGPDGVPGLDKVGHVLGFGVPAALAWWLGAQWLVWVLVGHALVSEPLQQALAPGRAMDWLDTGADLVGIALGVWLVVTLRARSGHDEGMSLPTEQR